MTDVASSASPRRVVVTVSEMATEPDPHGREPLRMGQVTITQPGKVASLHRNVKVTGLDISLDDLLTKANGSFGTVYVESTRYEYPDDFTQQKKHDQVRARVEFTGDPTDWIVLSAGEPPKTVDDRGWRTTVHLSGVLLGSAPEEEEDGSDEDD